MKNIKITDFAGKEISFFCQMLCEGDKTYPDPGDCPVCGMHLKKLEVKP